MPSERILYRKIQVVLDEARRDQASTLEELAENIQKRSPLNFTYFNVRLGKRAVVEVCKTETIRKTIDICVDLNLINGDTAKLTPWGRKAVDPNYYDSTLRQQLKNALERFDVGVVKIEKTIQKMLAEAKPDRIPTWDAISDEFNLKSRDREKFHSFLTLLGMCKGITYSLKKIYLPKSSK